MKSQTGKMENLDHLRILKENIHEGKKYPCDICDKHFTQKIVLRRHKDSVHEGKKYECDKCDKQFTQKDHLRRHKDSIH